MKQQLAALRLQQSCLDVYPVSSQYVDWAKHVFTTTGPDIRRSFEGRAGPHWGGTNGRRVRRSGV